MDGRRRLVVASNRGPVVYRRTAGGREARRGGGGLVTALSGLVAAHDVTWVAAAITDEDRAVAGERDGSFEETDRTGHPFRLRLLDIPRQDYDHYYNVVANPLLWFIQHGLWNQPYAPVVTGATKQAWDAYVRVNASFAAAVAEEADGCNAILVHDYHLYLVPAHLRQRGVRTRVSHFTHVPWPGPDAWRVLPAPVRVEILSGLLGADVIGFHTVRSVRAFLACCAEFLPTWALDPHQVRAYPISIDSEEFDGLRTAPAVLEAEAALLADRPERLVLRVDRTDPSKNVVRGFQAFARFLAGHPEWHGRVRMLALLDPSRQEIPEYAEYVGAIHRAARAVNDQFARVGWVPIDLRVGDNFPEAVAGYKNYDVLLVNAIADGMNLVAKEAPLVNDRDGVVILSENAGAHEEIGEHALSVNPFDVEQTAEAIAVALEMPADERAARAAAIREQVRTNDVRRWIADQLRDLDA